MMLDELESKLELLWIDRPFCHEEVLGFDVFGRSGALSGSK